MMPGSGKGTRNRSRLLAAQPSEETHSTRAHILDPTREGALISARLNQLISYHVRRVQLKLSKMLERVLDGELTPAVLHMLLIIDENPGVTMSAIASAHGVDRASLAPAIRRMQENGWIDRVASSNDKRALTLWCTDKGRALALSTLAGLQELENELLADLSAAERKTLLALLHRTSRSRRGARSPLTITQ